MPDGEFGELVFTSLTKEAMPVIRYRTRDLTRLLPGTARTMRRIERISGRSDDMLIIRGVNVFPSQVEVQVLAVSGLSPHFQIVIDQDGNLTSLTVNVEADPENQRAEDELAAELAKRIKENIGVSATVVVVANGQVPRSQGKAQRVVDNRR